MKLTISKKIILVISVVSVLFISTVVPCFASSGGEQNGYLMPLFYPSSFTILNSDYSYGGICDIPNSFYYSASGDFSSSVIYNEDISSAISTSGSVLQTTSQFSSGYGYSYIFTTISNNITFNDFNSYGSHFAFYFDDIYLPYQIIQNSSVKLNWLSDLSFNFVGATPSITRISFKVNYIDKSNDRFVQNTKVAGLQYDGFISTSRGVTDLIYNYIQSNTTHNDRLGGVVISDLAVIYPNVDDLTDVDISGTTKCVLPSSIGFAEAYDRWADYRTVITNTVVNNNTVIGNLVNGINDVWQLKLFGEFTIGALFSACVGVSLFIWILKIFAGG